MEQGVEWVRETMRQFGDQISEIRRDVGDVRERLIRMEASTIHDTVEGLKADLAIAKAKIDALEAARDMQAGASKGLTTAADWLHKLAPWIFATALVVASNSDKLLGH